MRARHLIIGNWKMNLGPTEAQRFAREMRATLPQLTRTDVWVAPSPVSVPGVASELHGSAIQVGSQNVHFAECGAYTGETSPAFLLELGATFSLVGHSERRIHFGETSALVAERTAGALRSGLTAVLCIGETETDRTEGRTETVLLDQLTPVLAEITSSVAPRLILAYEPVWAIGTGKVASRDDIAMAHRFIESVWNRNNLASPVVIIYGGSVNPNNFAEILALREVDGALVGGASIKPDQWRNLIDIAEATPVE